MAEDENRNALRGMLNTSVPHAPHNEKEIKERRVSAMARHGDAVRHSTDQNTGLEQGSLSRKVASLRAAADINKDASFQPVIENLDGQASGLYTNQTSAVTLNMEGQLSRIQQTIKEEESNRYIGKSDDGRIVATVNGNGRLVDLSIEDRLQRFSCKDLENGLVGAVLQARDVAVKQWKERAFGEMDPS